MFTQLQIYYINYTGVLVDMFYCKHVSRLGIMKKFIFKIHNRSTEILDLFPLQNLNRVSYDRVSLKAPLDVLDCPDRNLITAHAQEETYQHIKKKSTKV